MPNIDAARIVPVVDRVFGFDEIETAKSYVASNALLGKAIVSID